MSAQSTATAITLNLSPEEARELCLALDDRLSELRADASDHATQPGDISAHLASWRIRQTDTLDPVLERLWKVRELAAREAAKACV